MTTQGAKKNGGSTDLSGGNISENRGDISDPLVKHQCLLYSAAFNVRRLDWIEQ